MANFGEFDLNDDGLLTEKVFNEARANRIKARSRQGYPMRNLAKAPVFNALDLNADGRVDPQAFATARIRQRMSAPVPSQR